MRRMIIVVLLAVTALFADRENVSAQTIPPCIIADKFCVGPQAWVWQQIFTGGEANLLAFRRTENLSSSAAALSILSPAFIRKLIMTGNDSPLVSALGISISNGDICDPAADDDSKCDRTGPRSIVNWELPHIEGCERSRCAASLDLRDVRFKGGLALRHMRFHGDVALGGAYFEQVLNLDESDFFGDVDAYRLRVDGGISLYLTKIRGNFEGDGLRTAGSANFFKSTVHGSIHLRNALIGRDLDFGRISVDGPSVVSAPAGPRSSVELPRSAIDISNASIAGQFYATGVRANSGNVDLSGSDVGGSVWMEVASDPQQRQPAEDTAIATKHPSSTSSEKFPTQFDCSVTMERAHIGKDLLLGGGRFYKMDLTSTRIEGALRLESDGSEANWTSHNKAHDNFCNRTGPVPAMDVPQPPPPVYAFKSWLVLRNAQVYAIRDKTRGWPDCLTLAGLYYVRAPTNLAPDREEPKKQNPDADTDRSPAYRRRAVERHLFPPTTDADVNPVYRSCGEETVYSADDGPDIDGIKEARQREWWVNWLARDPQLTSQDFAVLANALDVTDNHARADDIRYEMRKFDAADEIWPLRFASWISGYFTGFGVGSYAYRALATALILLLIGVHLMLRRFSQLRRNHPCEAEDLLDDKGRWWCVAATIQIIIPLIILSKGMDDFLHAPLVKDRPDTAPLHGPWALVFAGIALAGLALSGFLLQDFRNSFNL